MKARGICSFSIATPHLSHYAVKGACRLTPVWIWLPVGAIIKNVPLRMIHPLGLNGSGVRQVYYTKTTFPYTPFSTSQSPTLDAMFQTWKYDPETDEVQSLRQAFDPITARSSQHQACNRCHEKKVCTTAWLDV